ncbi:PP2C family protein-serine/threonine phosphatase [Streptomyces sp. NPDC007818]|uniref:PP2C family protein-serine/threonine phosphatase n=1 Tax=Streptomyces sp. NPDC007818 TaxID=3364780 RepID=UPI0036B8E26C
MPFTASDAVHSTREPWSQRAWVPPAVAMALTAIAGLALGPDFCLLPFYAAGPALAAGRGTPRTVLGSAAASMALITLAAAADGLLGHQRVWIALGGVVVVTAAACWVSVTRMRAERRLVDVSEVAETVQGILMPPPPPRTGPVALTGSYRSAARAARVGGDLFVAAEVPDGARILIADVQGKGLEAVEAAAVVLTAFRDATADVPALDRLARTIERSLAEHTSGDRFVTALFADIHHDGSVTLLSHGHPEPLLLRADGHCRHVPLPDPAPPLGLAALTGDTPTPRAGPSLTDGDRLLFYTDGLSEARDPSGTFYPLRAHAPALLADPCPASALDSLRTDVLRHTRRAPDDDSALLLCEFGPDPAGA